MNLRAWCLGGITVTLIGIATSGVILAFVNTPVEPPQAAENVTEAPTTAPTVAPEPTETPPTPEPSPASPTEPPTEPPVATPLPTPTPTQSEAEQCSGNPTACDEFCEAPGRATCQAKTGCFWSGSNCNFCASCVPTECLDDGEPVNCLDECSVFFSRSSCHNNAVGCYWDAGAGRCQFCESCPEPTPAPPTPQPTPAPTPFEPGPCVIDGSPTLCDVCNQSTFLNECNSIYYGCYWQGVVCLECPTCLPTACALDDHPVSCDNCTLAETEYDCEELFTGCFWNETSCAECDNCQPPPTSMPTSMPTPVPVLSTCEISGQGNPDLCSSTPCWTYPSETLCSNYFDEGCYWDTVNDMCHRCERCRPNELIVVGGEQVCMDCDAATSEANCDQRFGCITKGPADACFADELCLPRYVSVTPGTCTSGSPTCPQCDEEPDQSACDATGSCMWFEDECHFCSACSSVGPPTPAPPTPPPTPQPTVMGPATPQPTPTPTPQPTPTPTPQPTPQPTQSCSGFFVNLEIFTRPDGIVECGLFDDSTFTQIAFPGARGCQMTQSVNNRMLVRAVESNGMGGAQLMSPSDALPEYPAGSCAFTNLDYRLSRFDPDIDPSIALTFRFLDGNEQVIGNQLYNGAVSNGNIRLTGGDIPGVYGGIYSADPTGSHTWIIRFCCQ